MTDRSYTNRAQVLRGRVNAKDVEDTPATLLDRAIPAVMVGGEIEASLLDAQLSAPLDRYGLYEAFALVAACVLDERDTAAPVTAAYAELERVLAKPMMPEMRSRIYELGMALASWNHDSAKFAEMRAKRLPLPHRSAVELLGHEVLYQTADVRESGASLAFATVRAAIAAITVSPIETPAAVILTLDSFARRSGTTVRALLANSASALDEVLFDGNGEPRLTIDAGKAKVDYQKPEIAIKVKIRGSGTLVAGAHGLGVFPAMAESVLGRDLRRLSGTSAEVVDLVITLDISDGVEIPPEALDAISARLDAEMDHVVASQRLGFRLHAVVNG